MSRRPMNVILTSDSDATSVQRLVYVRDEYERPENCHIGPKWGVRLASADVLPSGRLFYALFYRVISITLPHRTGFLSPIGGKSLNNCATVLTL